MLSCKTLLVINKPTMFSCKTLSAWAMNRQCCLSQHCRLEPWTDNIGLLNTVGLSQEPTLLKQPSLSVGTTNQQCCSTRHCRVELETDTVSCRSVSFLEPTVMSTTHHCRYATVGSKSGSEVGFWIGSDIQIWGSECKVFDCLIDNFVQIKLSIMTDVTCI